MVRMVRSLVIGIALMLGLFALSGTTALAKTAELTVPPAHGAQHD